MGNMKLDYDNMTNDEIINLFKQQYETIKPKDAIEFFDKSNGIPSAYILKSRLNMTYGQLLVYIGLRKTPRICTREKRNDTIKKVLKKAYEEYGYIPTSCKILKKYNINISDYASKSGISYKEFVEKFGYEYGRITIINTINRKWNNKTDEEIFKEYNNLCIKLGRIATIEDIKKERKNGLYDLQFIRRRYKSFNNFKKLAGITYKIDDMTWYSKRKIKENMINLYCKCKKRPKTKDIIKCDELPTIPTIMVYFPQKTLNDIWIEIEKDMIKDYIKMKEVI